MYLISWLPGVIAFGVFFPLDQVLESALSPLAPMIDNLLHLVFFCSFDKVRWGSREVGAMRYGFSIRGQQGGMEYVMDPPGSREVEAICHRGDYFCYLKGAVSFGG